MDEETMLTHHEALLVQELALVRAKIQYVRLSKSELQKGRLPCLASKTGHVRASSSEQNESISLSADKQSNETSPEQTATGKDSSNPLTVDDLPKVANDDSSSIKEEVILRPQTGVKSADEQSSYKGILIPNKNSRCYYVVFNGPHAGIYENWEMAKKATDGVSNIKHQKYKSFLEAKTAANIFCREKLLPELHLILQSEVLKPKSPSLPKLKGEKITLKKEKEIIQNVELDIENFWYLYKYARLANEERLIDDKMFSKDGKNLSLFNFIKGANPEQVSEAFDYGLVKFIYPSQNLKEISFLPKEVVKAVKNYRTKVLRGEKDIFLKVQSSVPIWDEGQVIYYPQHLIQIGISSGEKFVPSTPMPCSLEQIDLFPLGLKKLEEFLQKAYSFTKDDHFFVNLSQERVLVYSGNFRPISQEDEEKIVTFQQGFVKGIFMKDHDKRVCPTIRKITRHLCEICGAEQSTNKKQPTLVDKEKGQDHHPPL